MQPKSYRRHMPKISTKLFLAQYVWTKFKSHFQRLCGSSLREEADISAIPASARHDPLAGRYYGETVKIRGVALQTKWGGTSSNHS